MRSLGHFGRVYEEECGTLASFLSLLSLFADNAGALGVPSQGLLP